MTERTMLAPVIRRAGEGEKRWFFGGGVFTWKLSSANEDIGLWEVDMVEGKWTPIHTHPVSESMWVLKGQFQYRVNDRLTSSRLATVSLTITNAQPPTAVDSLVQGTEDAAGHVRFHRHLPVAGDVFAAHGAQFADERGVVALEDGKTLNLVEDCVDLLELEFQGLHLLIEQVADLDDVGNAAAVVAGDDLPGKAAESGTVAKRVEPMMEEGGVLEGAPGKPHAAAEFDGQGGRPTAMRLFSGGIETHGVTYYLGLCGGMGQGSIQRLSSCFRGNGGKGRRDTGKWRATELRPTNMAP